MATLLLVQRARQCKSRPQMHTRLPIGRTAKFSNIIKCKTMLPDPLISRETVILERYYSGLLFNPRVEGSVLACIRFSILFFFLQIAVGKLFL